MVHARSPAACPPRWTLGRRLWCAPWRAVRVCSSGGGTSGGGRGSPRSRLHWGVPRWAPNVSKDAHRLVCLLFSGPPPGSVDPNYSPRYWDRAPYPFRDPGSVPVLFAPTPRKNWALSDHKNSAGHTSAPTMAPAASDTTSTASTPCTSTGSPGQRTGRIDCILISRRSVSLDDILVVRYVVWDMWCNGFEVHISHCAY